MPTFDREQLDAIVTAICDRLEGEWLVIGGAMLVAAGVPQVSGAWTVAMRWLRVRWACGCGLSL